MMALQAKVQSLLWRYRRRFNRYYGATGTGTTVMALQAMPNRYGVTSEDSTGMVLL